jgi:geranylgeranyl diphosphate synthase type II
MDAKVLKVDIENFFREYFEDRSSYNKKIYEAMRYSIEIGGKRIRPILMLLTYMLYKENYREILPISGALEMIHTYSLIHDDLPCMDDDDLRRGKPTNHKVYGEAIAVLAGDGLLNEAMNIMFKNCLKGDLEIIKACSIISEASGAEGMIGGQVVDILSEGRSISAEELLYMHSKKTGALIKAAILSGAVLGGADSSDQEQLSRFGDKLGLAFQIKDDILDVTGNVELLGKSTNSDAEHEKTNFISTYGLEKCRQMCSELTEDCIGILDSLSGNTGELKKMTLFLLEREY